jgi:hypothetical protein
MALSEILQRECHAGKGQCHGGGRYRLVTWQFSAATDK